MRGIHNVNNDSFENISPGPAAYTPIKAKKIISYQFEGRKEDKPDNLKFPGVGKYSILKCYKNIMKKYPNCVFGKESRENSLKNLNNPTNFNRYNLENPGVGSYNPNINYIKKKLIGFSFDKAPRELHKKIPDYRKNNVLINKNKMKNLKKCSSNYFNRSLIVDKSFNSHNNDKNDVNDTFRKENSFNEKSFNKTLSQSNIWYRKIK